MAKKKTTTKAKREARVAKAAAKRAKSRSIQVEVIRQMLALSTSGFGLVAALAWNSLIQEFVNGYVKKWLPKDSGLISLLIYAIIVTLLAVVITMQLSKLKQHIERR